MTLPPHARNPHDIPFLERSLALARANVDRGDGGPFGAVIVKDGRIIAEAWNQVVAQCDPTAHAEVLALREASVAVGSWRLVGCTLVVTLEPCPMCAGAAQLARVDRVVFGAWNDDYGAAGSAWDLLRDRRLSHRPEVVGGVLAEECGSIVREFFARHR